MRPRPATTPAVPDRAEISRIVERFLAGRAKARATAEAPPAGADLDPGRPGDRSAALVADAPAVKPRQPRPVDFVSEDDVRQAIQKGEKIYVGPRTIITPSARDLGEPREVFVRTM